MNEKLLLENQIVIMKALAIINEMPNDLIKELREQISITFNEIRDV